MKKRTVFISLALVLLALHSSCSFISRPALKVEEDSTPLFIIDPGHGGEDGGAVASDKVTVEKDLNLEIAHRVRDLLACYGYETQMTRTDDRSIHDEGANTVRKRKVSDLHNRLKILESQDRAVLISIHQNKFTNGRNSGAQVFFSGNNPDSEILAGEIQSAVCNLLQNENTRQIKQSTSSIYILFNATKPAVMVECGFLSNAEETLKLKDEEYQRKLAFSIVAGIINYLNIKTEQSV